MRTLLLGPYELSYDVVEKALPAGVAGVFALGHVDFEGVFRVERIGRDDCSLRGSLHAAIGSSTRFKYLTVASAQRAFETECELFHRFRPPGNITHPDRPRGSGWKCPVCLHHYR